VSDEISILQGKDGMGSPRPSVLMCYRGLIPVVMMVRIPGTDDRWAVMNVAGRRHRQVAESEAAARAIALAIAEQATPG
jgi:hypothetical protein